MPIVEDVKEIAYLAGKVKDLKCLIPVYRSGLSDLSKQMDYFAKRLSEDPYLVYESREFLRNLEEKARDFGSKMHAIRDGFHEYGIEKGDEESYKAFMDVYMASGMANDLADNLQKIDDIVEKHQKMLARAGKLKAVQKWKKKIMMGVLIIIFIPLFYFIIKSSVTGFATYDVGIWKSLLFVLIIGLLFLLFYKLFRS